MIFWAKGETLEFSHTDKNHHVIKIFEIIDYVLLDLLLKGASKERKMG